MLRKALTGAAALGAATLIAVGTASPAMASYSSYNFDQNDFGGVNVLSQWCVNVTDVNVIQLIDLLASGDASCQWNDTDINIKGDKDHKHGKYDYKNGYDD